MSTKIYDGCIVRNTDAVNLIQRLKDLKLPLREIITTKQAMEVARYIVSYFDNVAVNLDKLYEKSFWDHLFSQMIKGMSYNKCNTIFKRVYDTKVSVCVFPKTNNDWLLIPFSPAHYKEVDNYLMSLPWIEDYHYQNQTDRDEDIPHKEWSQREVDWHSALKGIGVPVEEMFSIDLVEDKNIIFLGNVVEQIENVEFNERVKRTCENQLWLLFSGENNIKTDNLIRKIKEFKKWEQENHLMVSTVYQQTQDVLKPNITEEDLIHVYE